MDDFDSLYAAATPVPHASESGRQEGRIPPGSFRPKPGTYKVVENHEAVANMAMRKAGKLEKIAGGLDTLKAPPKQSPQKQEENFDLTDDDHTEPGPDTIYKELLAELKSMRADRDAVKADEVYPPGEGGNCSSPYADKEIGHYGHYLPTYTVTMEIRQEHQDGTFSSIMTVGMPVTHVLQNNSSVTLISPIADSQYTFQPTAGSDIILNGKDLNNLHVFYPGTSFILDDYKILGMCFVKAK